SVNVFRRWHAFRGVLAPLEPLLILWWRPVGAVTFDAMAAAAPSLAQYHVSNMAFSQQATACVRPWWLHNNGDAYEQCAWATVVQNARSWRRVRHVTAGVAALVRRIRNAVVWPSSCRMRCGVVLVLATLASRGAMLPRVNGIASTWWRRRAVAGILCGILCMFFIHSCCFTHVNIHAGGASVTA
ncbi:hypothetical protein AVEN_246142-1, partial [Araneus ventricosus]